VTATATQSDVDAFVAAADAVIGAAEALRAQVAGGPVPLEGVDTARDQARAWRRKAVEGTLAQGGPMGLGLSRAFGEWDYGDADEPLRAAIRNMTRVWDERLGMGDFVLAP
jgi:ABC-type sugar transport system substrate-binding protein